MTTFNVRTSKTLVEELVETPLLTISEGVDDPD